MENIRDGSAGRMSPAHSQATKAKISGRSSKNSAALQNRPLMLLDLRRASGLLPERYWETVTRLPGESWTPNTSESPNAAVESTLSSILQDNAPPGII